MRSAISGTETLTPHPAGYNLASEVVKNAILDELVSLIRTHQTELLRENQRDLAAADQLDPTLRDRLKVDTQKVENMIRAVKQVRQTADPEGELISTYRHPNGLRVENRRVPFGLILIIYESRPDVTIEAAISAFKAGNRILLKGGKEAHHTNRFLVGLWHQALDAHNVGKDWVRYLETDRQATQQLIRDNTHGVDLIIPRGGDGLIRFIQENTDLPILVSGRGNNFVYVHADADMEKSTSILLNGKQRLSVCNATDKILIHSGLPRFKAQVTNWVDAFRKMNIRVVTDHPELLTYDGIDAAPTTWWDDEFLDPRVMLGIVDGLETAITTINRHSGGHTAAVLTERKTVAERFLNRVDCAAVLHNASTRFTDGGEFGMGAEIAISTQKLHWRGPVGLGQLLTNKYFVFGDGQIR